MPPVNEAPEETTPKVDPTSEEKRDEGDLTRKEKKPEGDPTQKGKTDKDDPSRTAGIPNWGWLLLFMVLAATPVALVVKSWKTPPATTHQTQSERPAPPQSQSPADKASAKTEQKLSALEAKLDELKDTEKRLSVLEARLDDTYSTVEAVGFSAGLFGVLITVITLFFALKESERVKDAMNSIADMETTFKKADGIQEQVETAKQAITETKQDVEYALSKSQEARTKVLDIYDRYAAIKEEAMQALDNAKDAKRLAEDTKKKVKAIEEDAAKLRNDLMKDISDKQISGTANPLGTTEEGKSEVQQDPKDLPT